MAPWLIFSSGGCLRCVPLCVAQLQLSEKDGAAATEKHWEALVKLVEQPDTCGADANAFVSAISPSVPWRLIDQHRPQTNLLLLLLLVVLLLLLLLGSMDLNCCSTLPCNILSLLLLLLLLLVCF